MNRELKDRLLHFIKRTSHIAAENHVDWQEREKLIQELLNTPYDVPDKRPLWQQLQDKGISCGA